MNEKLLQRIDELEQKAKANEAIITRLEEQNHQLYSRLTEVVNLLHNNGISLNSKQTNINSDDIDKSLNEVEEVSEQLDETIKGENQYYEDIYSDSSFLKNKTIPSNEEVESIENPEIIDISSEIEKKSDIKDDEHENPIDTTPFKPTMSNLLKKYYPSVYSDDDFNIAEEEPFEKSEGNQESMLDIDDLNKNKDNDAINLDDTNNEYLGKRVKLDPDSVLENQGSQDETKIEYEKSKGKKTFKLKNIRKSFNFQKIKTGIKKHWKKVVATVLVATATVSALVSAAVNNKEKDKDNASVIQDYDSDLPSKNAANEFGVNPDDVFNNLNFNSPKNQEQNKSNEKETYEINIDSKTQDEKANTDIDTNYQSSDKTYNMTVDNYSIGQDVKFNGEYIYQTSKDASEETNALHPYYTNNDKRSISAIQMVSPDGTQHVTITDNNEDQKNLLESMGWTIESYNVSNDTRNVEYEGWINNSDLEVSNGNHR